MNLLPIAMSATSILGCNKSFIYQKYKDTVLDEMGRDAPEFEDDVTLSGSIQPVSNKMYEQLGLDLNKNYIVIYSPALMQSIAQSVQPDRIIYNGFTFELVENKDWYGTNGWTKAIAVELKSLRDYNSGSTNQLQNRKSDIQ